jgi:UDP-galactopyranose mutase
VTDREVVILGGGLTGLTAAYALEHAGGVDWMLFEKEDRAGGHARSMKIDGYVFDYGPHILFTSDLEMERLIRGLLGENLRAQERQAFIYHAAYDLYTRFPFQAHLCGLPTEVVTDCLGGLVDALETRARNEFRPRTYEQWMRGTFGNAIAERLLIPYARKLWTVEPETMDFSWIDHRVPTPDVRRIVAGALTDDIAQIGATAHFWYPWHDGIEALPRALAERLPSLELGVEIARIDPRTRVVESAAGDEVSYAKLVFTLPLSTVSSLIPEVPQNVARACERLKYQGILNVNLGIARPDVSELHWVYFYEEAFPFHRLSFPGNFSPNNVPEGRSSISTEVAFRADSPPGEDAVSATLTGLQEAGILQPDDDIELIHAERIVPAYVIYDLAHEESVATIVSWLRSVGIHAAGRFGEWQYLNMDQAMKSGWRAAETILQQRLDVPSEIGAET